MVLGGTWHTADGFAKYDVGIDLDSDLVGNENLEGIAVALYGNLVGEWALSNEENLVGERVSSNEVAGTLYFAH